MAGMFTAFSATPFFRYSIICSTMRMPTISCASSVEPAMCGVASTVSSCEERMLAGRLLFEYVERGARDVCPESIAASRAVSIDQFAARAIDDANARLHLREGLGIQHVIGFGRERHVQRDVVAAPVKFGKRSSSTPRSLAALRADVGIVADHAHLERLGAPDHFAADAAQADDAERFAAQFVAEELLLFPLAGFGRDAGLRNRARHGQHQRQRVFSNRDGIAARRVHHQHAGFGCGAADRRCRRRHQRGR